MRRLWPQPQSTACMAPPSWPRSQLRRSRPSFFMWPIIGSMALRRRMSRFRKMVFVFRVILCCTHAEHRQMSLSPRCSATPAGGNNQGVRYRVPVSPQMERCPPISGTFRGESSYAECLSRQVSLVINGRELSRPSSDGPGEIHCWSDGLGLLLVSLTHFNFIGFQINSSRATVSTKIH